MAQERGEEESMPDEPVGVDHYAGIRARCVDAVGRKLGGRLRLAVDPEDIVQDSFVRALTRGQLQHSGVESPLEGRLRIIARHRIWEEARRLGREGVSGHVHAPSSEVEVEVERAGREGSGRIWEELSQLRHDHRSVLVLRCFLEVPWETVALVMDQPSVNAAECLHRRAQTVLRSRLPDLQVE